MKKLLGNTKYKAEKRNIAVNFDNNNSCNYYTCAYCYEG